MARLTWQNVDAPDFGSSVQGLKNAFDSFDRGIERAGQTIDQYDAAQTAAQSNDIMAKVLQLQTPEAVAAAQASGALTAGIDPRRINAAAFAAMAGRQDDLLRTASSGVKLREDQIDLGQSEVQNKDFMDFNSEPVRAILNQRARALADGNQQEVDRLENENQPVFDRLSQAMLNGSTSSAQGLRQTSQSMRGIDASYEDGRQDREMSLEDRAIEQAAEAELGANYREGTGEEGVNNSFDAIVERQIAKGMSPSAARRVAERVSSGVRGQGAEGGEFDVVAAQMIGDTSGGGVSGAVGSGNSERIVNFEAKGRTGVSVVPPEVRTLGDLVEWGKRINKIGKNPESERSSATGLYQITQSTYREFGEAALGRNWQNAPLNAENQDKVAQKIFQDAAGKPDPVKALRGRWAALKNVPANEIQAMIRGGWGSARNRIAQLESGGSIGRTGSRVTDPGAGPTNNQTDAERAKIVSDVAINFKLSTSDTIPLAKDLDVAYNNKEANDTDVATQLVKGPLAGENMVDVRETLQRLMKSQGISNPAVMGAIMARSIGKRKGVLGRIDNALPRSWGSTGLSINFDADKLKQMVLFAKNPKAVATTNLVRADSERAKASTAATNALVPQLTALFVQKFVKENNAGKDTTALRARYNAAMRKATGIQSASHDFAAQLGLDNR